MNNAYKEITIEYDTTQIIRKEDWKTLADIKYFTDSVDKDELSKFIRDLPYLDVEDKMDLHQFLKNGVEIPGLRHCDTQEREDRWRIQIHINYRLFPKAAYLTNSTTLRCSFSGGDNVVLTFSISKNEEK